MRTCAEAAEFYQQNAAHFSGNPEEENLNTFVALHSKAPERGDADKWRQLATRWHIARNKFDIMKAKNFRKLLRLRKLFAQRPSVIIVPVLQPRLQPLRRSLCELLAQRALVVPGLQL